MHYYSFVDGSPGDQLLLSLRCTAMTKQRPGCSFESRQMQDVLERLKCEQDVHHTLPHKVRWHGEALYQVGREARRKDWDARLSIFLHMHPRHYGFDSSYSNVRKRTPPALRPATGGHSPLQMVTHHRPRDISRGSVT